MLAYDNIKTLNFPFSRRTETYSIILRHHFGRVLPRHGPERVDDGRLYIEMGRGAQGNFRSLFNFFLILELAIFIFINLRTYEILRIFDIEDLKRIFKFMVQPIFAKMHAYLLHLSFWEY